MDIQTIFEKALADIQPMLESADRSIRIAEASDDSCVIELTGFCDDCSCTENYTAGILEVFKEKVPTMKNIRFIHA